MISSLQSLPNGTIIGASIRAGKTFELVADYDE